MMASTQEALSAYQAGDREGAARALLASGPMLRHDLHGLQLLGLVQEQEPDGRALFECAALDVDPGDAQAMFNLGVADQAAGLLTRAQFRYEQALRSDPQHLGALNNLSDLLRRRRRSAEAWDCLCRYRAAGGDTAGLEIRYAKVADECGHVDAARDWFRRAADRVAGTAEADAIHWEWAMQQLRDEEFALGWVKYELRRARFDHDVLAIVDYPSIPEWTGDDLTGRSLLVHKEQGLGDTIMFASCLDGLAEDAAALHLAVAPTLVRLFAHSIPTAQVWPSVSDAAHPGEEHQPWRAVSGAIDAQIPFGTLPLHRRRQGFPAARAFLSALPEDVAAWAARLARMVPAETARLHAGLVLAAGATRSSDPGVADGEGRSIAPVQASGLAVDGVAWFGLHERHNCDLFTAIPGLSVVHCGDWIHDMADTAALIANLDVVVTVDTSVAHVAAASGAKVLLMLRRHGDWRWGRDRTDSYWYPDVEIFRQEREGAWEPVIARVAARLAELAAR